MILTNEVILTVDDFEIYVRRHFANFKSFTDRVRGKAKIFIEQNLNKKVGKKRLNFFLRRAIDGGVSRYTKRFWLERGWTEEEAKAKIAALQIKNSQAKSLKLQKLKTTDEKRWKSTYNMYPEYYERFYGVSRQEAEKMVKDRQTTFSLEKCIAKHGSTEGQQIWMLRQEKWQNTLNKLPEERRIEIMQKKVVPLGRASKESLSVFLAVHEFLKQTFLFNDEDVFYGLNNRKEWFINDDGQFLLYDFCVPKLKAIIEYNGEFWHPDYRLTESELDAWTCIHSKKNGREVRTRDEEKIALAERRGFKVLQIWGRDDAQTNVTKCVEFLRRLIEETTFEVNIEAVEKIKSNADVYVNSSNGYVLVTDFIKQQKNTFKLLLEDGYTLTCSPDHQLRLADGGWVNVIDIYAARELALTSMRLQTRFGLKRIISIVDMAEERDVYDLTVNHDDHSYFTNDIVSHNCGKTLIALASALDQLKTIGNDGKYDKFIVMRPVQPMGKEIGFLPGTIEEKMAPWIAPIKDNLNFLLDAKRTQRRKKPTPGGTVSDDEYIKLAQENGLIEVEAITFIRGRSLPNAFILIDEAQNLSVHEVKTLITRVGEEIGRAHV